MPLAWRPAVTEESCSGAKRVRVDVCRQIAAAVVTDDRGSDAVADSAMNRHVGPGGQDRQGQPADGERHGERCAQPVGVAADAGRPPRQRRHRLRRLDVVDRERRGPLRSRASRPRGLARRRSRPAAAPLVVHGVATRDASATPTSAAERGQVAPVLLAVVAFRRLEDAGMPGEALVVQEQAKRFGPQLAFADMGVSIDPRARDPSSNR